MKKFLLIIVTIVLSIVHVHLSICTPGNGLNPLTLILMIDTCAFHEVLSERLCFIVFGSLVQSGVTAVLAYYIAKWRNKTIWAALTVLSVVIAISIYVFVDSMSEPIFGLSALQHFYNDELYHFSVFKEAITLIPTQMIVFFLYPVLCLVWEALLKKSKMG